MSEDEIKPKRTTKRVWLIRAGFLALALITFTIMPFVLVLIGDLTGVSSFSDIFGPLVFWNQLSGTGFLAGFAAICFFITLIMFFILKAFHVEEGGW
jgi:hypothetical protein